MDEYGRPAGRHLISSFFPDATLSEPPPERPINHHLAPEPFFDPPLTPAPPPSHALSNQHEHLLEVSRPLEIGDRPAVTLCKRSPASQNKVTGWRSPYVGQLSTFGKRSSATNEQPYRPRQPLIYIHNTCNIPRVSLQYTPLYLTPIIPLR